ncbi:MAG TPA: hypothetical protein VK717_01620 [Opitutaceae bacterium]|nr:hypothetical protein [Opitutaceae bacterium]
MFNILFFPAPPETKKALKSFIEASRITSAGIEEGQSAQDSWLERMSSWTKRHSISSFVISALFSLVAGFSIWHLMISLVPAGFRPIADIVPILAWTFGILSWWYLGVRSTPGRRRPDMKAVAFALFLASYKNDLCAAKICLNDSELYYKNVRAVWGTICLSIITWLMGNTNAWGVIMRYGMGRIDGCNRVDVIATITVFLLIVCYNAAISFPSAWINALIVAGRNHDLRQGN